MPIVFNGELGGTYYAQFSDGTLVALTAGAGNLAKRFTATDAAIVTAGLAQGDYDVVIVAGTTGSASVNDERVSSQTVFSFDGTNEVTPPTLAQLLAASDYVAVDLDPVPKSRTWTLVARDGGMVGIDVLKIQAGEAKTFAFDFRKDLGNGAQIADVTACEPETPTNDLAIAILGKEQTQGKVRITVGATPTAGEHRIRCQVTYSNGDTAEGDGRLLVVV